MAMMMTGRVLLVCALCVLWCGAGGRCDEEGPAVPAGGAGPPPGSKELGTLPQDTQELKVGSQDIKVKVPPAPSPSLEEDEDEDSNPNEEEETTEDTEEEEEEKIKAQNETHEGKNNEGASIPPPPPIPSGDPTAERGNPQNPKKVTNEATPSGPKMEFEAPEPPSGDATQGQHRHDTDTEDSTKNAAAGSPAEKTTTSSTSTSGSGDHVQNKAEENDAQSSEGQHDSLETGNTNVVPTLSEEAPQTPKTITAARINGTATPDDSDGSTAVSHTTSPLLLLLLVACAAAAAVVAA
ncbi:Mucin-associated surface protein (MASP) [Trypanosoma cruzi]|uniref:Mucin-associated surface protein (MASP), putative n=2 Tax=Trypanosoma cruzi TaxID=5693 RepID=Q4DBI1_TRYCC|nr:mucin-associated surface protein (MASP), putative [Trypanosoma cruzi]EAN89889.1 mucin-associated surface protein (MASP), putative [Trypanosoma cruzi]PWV09805.1 Mucin-associated surface protein (MASP) [Trypanosoma cruzi]|eukprot:XP_811740.1 mucin-associated surface protein (MASP) [Trypanosoma cruzi strain CL Brener]